MLLIKPNEPKHKTKKNYVEWKRAHKITISLSKIKMELVLFCDCIMFECLFEWKIVWRKKMSEEGNEQERERDKERAKEPEMRKI